MAGIRSAGMPGPVSRHFRRSRALCSYDVSRGPHPHTCDLDDRCGGRGRRGRLFGCFGCTRMAVGAQRPYYYLGDFKMPAIRPGMRLTKVTPVAIDGAASVCTGRHQGISLRQLLQLIRLAPRNRNYFKHGHYTAETVASRRQVARAHSRDAHPGGGAEFQKRCWHHRRGDPITLLARVGWTCLSRPSIGTSKGQQRSVIPNAEFCEHPSGQPRCRLAR
jgi:hypothetical protein